MRSIISLSLFTVVVGSSVSFAQTTPAGQEWASPTPSATLLATDNVPPFSASLTAPLAPAPTVSLVSLQAQRKQLQKEIRSMQSEKMKSRTVPITLGLIGIAIPLLYVFGVPFFSGLFTGIVWAIFVPSAGFFKGFAEGFSTINSLVGPRLLPLFLTLIGAGVAIVAFAAILYFATASTRLISATKCKF
jgi:hypothetical protein